jgi:thioredoxin-like negative regulator of GroEL
VNKAIYFKGENCSVCKALLPKMQAHFAANYPLLDFEIVEVEKQPEIAAQFNVFTIPVVVIFFDDKEHFRFVRNFSASEIDQKLERTYQLRFQ